MFTRAEIQEGFENKEFFLEYLPVMALQSGRCVGAEALIRWCHQGRVVPPMEFIPVAEETLLIGWLTYWVVEQMAQELGEWLEATPEAYLSINVPPELWGRGGTSYVLRKSSLGSNLDRIVLEVTERGVPDKLAVATINDRGHTPLKVALDDVMSQEADLVLLARLSVDMLKIDRIFAASIMTSSWPTRKDEMFLQFCRESDRTIVIEGVEHQLQADVLREAGIRFAQGWYFSKSLPAEAFKAFYAARSSEQLATDLKS